MRDVEDLMLQSLRTNLSSSTGIPSGNIWLKKPAIEFLNKPDGPNTPATNPSYLPAISINYLKDAQFAYNNYGGNVYKQVSNTVSTIYSPLGELHLFLTVSLFTASKKQQRELGTLIYMDLLNTPQLNYINDEIANEYCNVLLKLQKDISGWDAPLRKDFVVNLQGFIRQETTGYIVTGMTINLSNTTANPNYVVTGLQVNIEGGTNTSPSGIVWY